MASIDQKTMDRLIEHRGCEVLTTTVHFGKKSVAKQKLHQMREFGHINNTPFIGKGVAVVKIENAETGEILLENPIIHEGLSWYSNGMMWLLRLLSYGYKMTRQIKANKNLAYFIGDWNFGKLKA